MTTHLARGLLLLQLGYVTRFTLSKFATGLTTYLIDRVNLGSPRTREADEDGESSREVFVYRMYRKTFTVMNGSECTDRGWMRGY
ncbi:hypothetical protein DM02DRAFT_616660 [Periconia macrospinosa]|uniref:Secreted protein n=1 Tax=Periconia macrospinosa TaxID=97972 RepID=A0A2V1DJ07_9PLEO|nr:hypothetical protein DM02DRAFT_616660 [Periconia macrospinosa]